MFKATINTNVLQSSIRALSAFIDETLLIVTPDGISTTAIDVSNAGMASINIPSTECTVFDVTDAELGIDLTRFKEILGMANKSNDVTLELDDDTHKLGIAFDGFVYTIALLDPTNLRKQSNVPQLELPAEITIEGSAFKRAVKAASMVGDYAMMGVQDNTFFMSATGDSDNVRLDLSGSELIDLKPADVSSLYSLEYLSDMGRGIGTASEIVIHLGRDLPMILDFESSVDCPVVYVLAPRISEE